MRGTASLIAAAALAAAQPALAQAPAAPPQPPAKPAPETVAPVVVSAQRPAVRELVDRTVYDVSQDLEAQVGTLADALRNLPLVDVDLDGNPSIRGDTGVQILVNGHPAPMLNGADRGAILQMLGADNIQSVEVLTNPSARFPPDGSAGIINIVTKRPFSPTPTGIARANWQSEGGWNFGLNGQAGAEPLSFNGGINLRDDARKRVSRNYRAYTDPTSGDPVQIGQDSTSGGLRFSRSARLGADYTPTDIDTFTLELDAHDRGGRSIGYERDVTLDPIAGGSNYERTSTGTDYGVDTDAGLTWRRDLGGDNHEISLDVERSESVDRSHTGYRNAYLVPVQPDTLDEEGDRSDEATGQVNLNYKGPLGAKGRIEAGYALKRDDDAYDNYGGDIDPITGARTANAALTNRFKLGQTVQAVYATWQRPVGKLTILAGLRLEGTQIDADQQTSAVTARNAYFKAYPSLHLQYALSKAQSLKLSYTLRASRPGPGDLNPYLVYQDAFNVRAGNPDLEPQTTEAIEASWQENDKGGSRAATLYWRETYGVLTDVTRYIAPTVLLTTKANLGRINSTGMDVVAQGKPSAKFSYTVNGYLFYNQVDAQNLGFSGIKAGFGYSGKFSLDWRPTDKDQWQLSANYNSSRLSPQGELQPNGGADIGYKRQITGALAAVININDLFDSRIQKTQFDNPVARMLSVRQAQGRTASIGLTWRLGGAGGRKG